MTESPTELQQLDIPVQGESPDAWLRRLIHDHSSLLRRIAAAQLGSDEADDVVSLTYAVAWKQRESFDPLVASERAWLVGITLNRCRAMGRARRRWIRRSERASVVLSEPDFVDEAHARLDAVQQHARLMRALNRLPDEQREVLLLIAHAGLTTREVAEALERSHATVRSQLARARSTVTAALNQERRS